MNAKFSVVLGILAALAFTAGAAVSKPISEGAVASVCADNSTKSSGGGHMGCTACSHYGCTDYDCDYTGKTVKCKSESLQAVKRQGKTPVNGGTKTPVNSGTQMTGVHGHK